MRISFELHDGSVIEAEVEEGTTVKDAALAANVPDILGECGGNLSCATCHVVVDDTWISTVGGPGDMEDAMLDVTMVERQENSRLSCQITMSPALDGLKLRVPH